MGMDDTIYIMPDEIEIIDSKDYSSEVVEHFSTIPEVAKPLLQNAKVAFTNIEKMLYSAPAVLNVLKASVPVETFQAVFTNEQKSKLANGTLKLMTKKDGTLMANLVNPETKKIVSSVSLESVKNTPEISQAMTSFATQMQMAQIAEQIQLIQVAVEEVRQGLEYDRLATAYSCQQKLLQAMSMKTPELKTMALLRVASDAEDSRNLLMLSQNANLTFIKNQPESFWGKLVSAAPPEKVNARMGEIRESLCAVNMVSLAEAIAYQELGENEVAKQSLQYYADYIQKTYLETDGLVERLDLIDPSPENYWSQKLPYIKEKIQALPSSAEYKLLGGEKDGE